MCRRRRPGGGGARGLCVRLAVWHATQDMARMPIASPEEYAIDPAEASQDPTTVSTDVQLQLYCTPMCTPLGEPVIVSWVSAIDLTSCCAHWRKIGITRIKPGFLEIS